MNYGEYMRRLKTSSQQVIGFQNGQDASQVTLKNRARASTVTVPVPVATTFSQVGGDSYMAVVPTISGTTNVGFTGVSLGPNTDPSSRIYAAQRCAVCSDSTQPYSVVIPCYTPLPIVTNAPGQERCCSKDTSQLFRNNAELVAEQGRQSALRTKFNLPSKLQGLRGPVMNSY